MRTVDIVPDHEPGTMLLRVRTTDDDHPRTMQEVDIIWHALRESENLEPEGCKVNPMKHCSRPQIHLIYQVTDTAPEDYKEQLAKRAYDIAMNARPPLFDKPPAAPTRDAFIPDRTSADTFEEEID
jgi:hypothetical protein